LAGVFISLALPTSVFAAADAPTTGVPPTSPVLPTPQTAASFSAPFQYTNGKIVVQARINGLGPYSLALDSGAETMMISQQVVDACKLSTQTGTVQISGTSGNYVPVSQAQVDRLDIGGSVVNKPFCTISPRPISVDGYIGAPLFNAYTVQIDFGSHQIICFPSDGYKPDPMDQMIPIPFGKHRVPVAQGAIGGVAAKFEVDTGSTFPAELAPGFVQSNDLSHKFQQIGTVMTNSVSGPAPADVYGAPSLSLGSSPALPLATNVPTLFMGTAVGDWDGRIGAAVLANFVVTFDYAHSRLYIRPAQAASTGPAVPTATAQPPTQTVPSPGANTSPAGPTTLPAPPAK
jgi:hypothetical protein